jgi:hypothetical protein
MLEEKIKTAVFDRDMAMRRKKFVGPEPIDLRFISKPTTAYWKFKDGQHIIRISDQCDAIYREGKPPMSKRQKRRFYIKVLEHERCHGEYTPRGSDLGETITKSGISKQLWNMFEDARIEHKWRSKHGKFQWMLTCGLTGHKNPSALFMDCKHLENARKPLREWLLSDEAEPATCNWDGDETKVVRTRVAVHQYFRMAIKAKTTEALFPILKSWIKTFPSEGGGISIPGFFIEDIDSPADTGDDDEDGEPNPEPVPDIDASTDKEVELPDSNYISKEKVTEIDHDRAERLVRLFARWLRHGERHVMTSTPTPHLNMRRYVEGRSKFYRRRADDPLGVKSAVIIYDTSGSMAVVNKDGVYFLYIINALVKRGLLRCRELILSGGKPLALKLPLDPRIIEHIQCPGAHEGFANTMDKYRADLIETDLTLFFTDGHITDRAIDRAQWHEQGVYSIGMYVTDDPDLAVERSREMEQYFDSVLVRQSIEGIADSLIQILKPERR